MRAGLTGIGWMLILVAAAGCASVSPTSIARGRLLAQANCSNCHTIAGQAPSPLADAPRFADLERLSAARGLDEIFAKGTLTGHPPMPMFVGQSQAMGDLLDYIRSIQPRTVPSPPER